MTDDMRDDFEDEAPLFEEEEEDQAPFDDFSDLSDDFEDDFGDLDDFDDLDDDAGRTRPFLGIAPFQRFVLAAWLLLLSCLLSGLCLLFTNTIVWPF